MRKTLSKTACKPHVHCLAPVCAAAHTLVHGPFTSHLISAYFLPLNTATASSKHFQNISSSIIQLILLPYTGQNIFIMVTRCHSCSFIGTAWQHLCPLITSVGPRNHSSLQTLISTHSSNILTPLHAAQNFNISSFFSIVRHNLVMATAHYFYIDYRVKLYYCLGLHSYWICSMAQIICS